MTFILIVKVLEFNFVYYHYLLCKLCYDDKNIHSFRLSNLMSCLGSYIIKILLDQNKIRGHGCCPNNKTRAITLPSLSAIILASYFDIHVQPDIEAKNKM